MDRLAAAWYPDPKGRFEHRYWDGMAWTGHVASRGIASEDLNWASESVDVPALDEVSLPQAKVEEQAGIQSPQVGEEHDSDVARAAKRYAASCRVLVDAVDAATRSAELAIASRHAANSAQNLLQREQRPAIRLFAESMLPGHLADAVRDEAAFVDLVKRFMAACEDVRTEANLLRDVAIGLDEDVELVLLRNTESDSYRLTIGAIHILSSSFPTTPSGFVEAHNDVALAVQGDIFNWGESGFIGRVHSPPPPQIIDRPCPWCAELIKAAAIICRFCNREVGAEVSAIRDRGLSRGVLP